MSVDFNIADFFKLPCKIFAAIALATGMVLFLPDEVINKIYLSSFRENCGFVIGIAFIISASIVCISVIVFLFDAAKHSCKHLKFKAGAGKRLKGLDDYQKMLVYGLYDEINHTSVLPMNDGAVRALESFLIIGKATNQYPVEDLSNPMFPYFLQPWVVQYLTKHNEVVSEFASIAEKVITKMEKEEKKKHNSYSWGNGGWQ